jgi:DNA-binding protein
MAKTDSVVLSGPTDAAMLAKLNDAVLAGTKKIIISSRGGRESVALDIAEIIRKNGMELEINDACTSACAQYLMVAASKVEISENAVVSFHLNSFGILKMVDENDIKKFNIEELKNNRKRAENLYLKKGVSLTLLEESTYQVEPLCLQSNPQGEQLINKYDFWIPTENYLKNIGVKFQGFWPKNIKEAKNLAKLHYISSAKFKFGVDNKSNFRRKIVRCDSYYLKL